MQFVNRLLNRFKSTVPENGHGHAVNFGADILVNEGFAVQRTGNQLCVVGLPFGDAGEPAVTA